MTYRIIDLDNCISNDAHRIGAIRWQCTGDARYIAYHQLAGFDTLGNRDLIRTEHDLVILTGRPTMFRPLTERWLAVNGVLVRHLIMRNDYDLRHSAALKQGQLEWLLSLYEVDLSEIVDAYDDRPDVVAMYRAAGIRNAHVRALHDLDAYRITATL